MIQYKVMSLGDYLKSFPEDKDYFQYIDPYTSVLVKFEDGASKGVIFGDSMEPEDATLTRDLGILVEELNELAKQLNEIQS